MIVKCVFVLTLSDPDSEDTEEDEECCWGLGMDMGESALCGDTESLCCSSDPTLVLTTQGSCSDTSSFGGKTINETRFPKFMSELLPCLNPSHLLCITQQRGRRGCGKQTLRKVYLCCLLWSRPAPPTS